MKYKIIPVTGFFQNCSIIWCKKTGKAVIIDPGGESDRIKNEIKNINLIQDNLKKIKIEKILITHGHIDHVGSANDLSMYYKVPILGPHKKEKNILQNIEEQFKLLKIPFLKNSIVNNNIWLLDKEKINFGYICLTILHCPGHSPGHIIFLNKKEKIIFSGDLLFKGNVGRTDLPGGNLQDLLQSIKKILCLSDDYVIVPGHGPVTTVGEEKRYNPFLRKFLNF